VSRAETSFRFGVRLPALGLVCLGLLAIACSAGSGGPAPDPGQTPAPGDVRFLFARNGGIEEITLSGQDKRLLTLDKLGVLQPSISPDGKSIAFIAEIPARTASNGLLDFGADLYVSDRDGANPHPVLLHSRVGEYLESPDWLDSKSLYVGVRGLDTASGKSFSRILKVNVASGAQEVVLENAVIGAISRDRKSLVFSSVDPQTRVEQLVVGDVKGGSPHVIVPDTSGLALFLSSAFSPDGSQIAFAAVDVRSLAPPPRPPSAPATAPPPESLVHPFAQDVWLINRDGSNLHRLGEIAENMPSLTWSGDGSSIYVIGPNFLWRLDPAAGTAEQLRESKDRAWIVWLEGK
jgi:Tol biopolymer transport system component